MIRVHDAPVASSEYTIWNGAEPATSIFGDDFIDQWAELRDGGVVRFDAGGVLIAGQSAVEWAMHNPLTFSSGPEAFFLGSDAGLIPIQKDPPEHTRYRRMLDRLFAPQQIAHLERPVVEQANACIDAIVANRSCEVVADLAIPVPSVTILALLGFPAERLDEFLQIKSDIFRPDPTFTPEQLKQHTARAAARAFEFFGSVLDERARSPRSDLASHLASLELAGELSRPQSADICLMMLLAGLDTVTAALTNMLYNLALRADLRERLVADPDLIPKAVEELLRVTAPVPNSPRICTEDVELEGCPVRKGERVTVLVPVSNFDPELYDNPKEIDFSRPANRHASFGVGKHRCLGSHLARLELQVILREWHRRIPDYRIPYGHQVQWNRGIREISELPLELL